MGDFLKDGVRFECQGSGKCCTSRGSHGFIYVSLKDRKVFAKYFKLTTGEFTKRYCSKTNGWYHLSESEGDCRFLKGKSCSVYEARPIQCRTWPFWPEHLNARAWKKEIADFCPGVGKGRHYSAEEIAKISALEKKNQATP